MTKKSTVIALATVILTASAFGFNGVALAAQTSSSWKTGQKQIKEYLKHAPSVSGTVQSVSGSTISLLSSSGTLYSIETSQAKIVKNRNTIIALSDIKTGDTLTASGTFNGTQVSATTIFDGKPIGSKKAHGTFPGIMGVASGINGNTFSVTTKDGKVYTVAVTGSTKILKGSPAVTGTISDITSGDTVMVRGTISDTTVTAQRIFDGNHAVKGPHLNAKKKKS